MNDLLPDGRNRLEQQNSLLRSQLVNCNKEIQKLRSELLRHGARTDDPIICVCCGKPASGRCTGFPS